MFFKKPRYSKQSIESACTSHYSINAKAYLKAKQHKELFEVLHLYLEDAQSDTDREFYFYSVDVSGMWKEVHGEFKPNNKNNIKAWRSIAADLSSHPYALKWFEAIFEMLTSNVFWEYDTVQLGQVPAFIFAHKHKKFIHVYAKLLTVWDLDHETSQSDEVNEIINKYGICDETEELIFTRMTGAGYPSDEYKNIVPLMNAKYGHFSKSNLFRRIVTAAYEKEFEWRTQSLQELQTRKNDQASLVYEILTSLRREVDPEKIQKLEESLAAQQERLAILTNTKRPNIHMSNVENLFSEFSDNQLNDRMRELYKELNTTIGPMPMDD